MPLTVTTSSRGWTTLRWLEADDARVVPCALDLARLPGAYVNLEYRSAEVSQSLWSSKLWREALSMAPLGWNEPRQASTTWRPHRPLFKHQEAGVEFLVRHGGGICADQMGLGKTTTAIVAAERMAQAESPHAARLIIAPGFTRDVWLRELLALGAITRPEQFCAVRSRNVFDPSFRPSEALWWFVHYEITNDWASRLVTNARGRPVVAIIDEAHWIKNGKSQRAKGTAVAAGSAACRILLSGTPLLNRPSELWSLLSVLDGPRSWGSPVEFRQRYCGAFHDGHGWQDGIMPTNQDELSERLSRRYLRRTVDEAGLDLPALSRQVYPVDQDDPALRAEEQTLIQNVGGVSALLDALDRGAFGTEILRALSRLGKITSKLKLRSTAEHLRGLLAQGEPAVCFVHERMTAEQLGRSLAEGPEPQAFVATGDVPQALRDVMVARFQAGERMALIATYGAMREGVTLHRARSVVLHDLSWRPADVLQAEARVHRIGQRRGCVSTWMMLADSFDTILARTLITKAQRIASTLGDSSAADALDEVGAAAFTGVSIDDEAQRLIAAYSTEF